MNSYDRSISFLYGLQKSGMKFGLRNIRRVLRSLDNPERSFRSVHIAGSNGKGSTAAMIASVLTAAGYRTGLYTSPHVMSFRERIRINGRPISPSDIVRLTRRLKPVVVRQHVTFFETVTAMAFKYFQEQKVDVAVVETGLGGRLDATNVLRPEVSVITSISREHTEILGNLIHQIAYEKAGIIKRGRPCVTAVRSGAALRVIRKTAQLRGARLYHAGAVRCRLKRSTLDGTVCDVKVGGMALSNMVVGLAGGYQIENARLALRSLEILQEQGFRFSTEDIRRGFSDIRRNSGIRSRLSVIQKRPMILTDVAHNAEAVRVLSRELVRLGIGRTAVMFGVMKDKNYRLMIRRMKRITSAVLLVRPKTDRARPTSDLRTAFEAERVPILYEGSVKGGIAFLKRSGRSLGAVLITGSHFVVGEACAALEGKKYLTMNQ